MEGTPSILMLGKRLPETWMGDPSGVFSASAKAIGWSVASICHLLEICRQDKEMSHCPAGIGSDEGLMMRLLVIRHGIHPHRFRRRDSLARLEVTFIY